MSSDEPIRLDKSCRICGSQKTKDVWELKPTPPGDRFVPESQLDSSKEKHPLILALCEACGYLHLPHVLDPKLIYSDYLYESKVTLGLRQHFKEYAEKVLSISKTAKGSMVVDLGSNDGSLLEVFQNLGMTVLGIEPSVIALKANDIVPTIRDYFNEEPAKNIVKNQGKAAIVTANYMYANIDDVKQFTRDAKELLDEDGIFVIQTGYHPEQMKIFMFDYIYHEHIAYFTVKVLSRLLQDCGFELLHVETNPMKGGSVRAIAQHAGGQRKIDQSVDAFIQNEEAAGMHKCETYFRFAEDINDRKIALLELLNPLKSENKRIVGYGASISTTTLAHQFEIGGHLEYIVDDNPIKQGLYSPGYHLPVYASGKLYEDMPEYVVILAWQYQDAIIERNREYLDRGGAFIVPLPDTKIVKK